MSTKKKTIEYVKEQFLNKYYMNGICFKCHGAGVVFKDDL